MNKNEKNMLVSSGHLNKAKETVDPNQSTDRNTATTGKDSSEWSYSM